MSAVAIGAALAAAAAFAVSNALQHHSAGQVAGTGTAHLGVIARLVRRPLWLTALAVNGLALALQALALSAGALTVVQPLLVCALLFALPVSRVLTNRRIRGGDYGWAALVVAGLATFLLAAAPTGGVALAGTPALVTALAAGAGVVAGCVALASRRACTHRAPLLALATGVCCGLVAALTKQVIVTALTGLPALLGAWPLYALLVAGAASLALGQSAYHAGPLTASLPVISITDPLVAIAAGILVFGETMSTTPSMLALAVAGFVAMAAGVTALSRRSTAAPEAAAATPAPVTRAGGTVAAGKRAPLGMLKAVAGEAE